MDGSNCFMKCWKRYPRLPTQNVDLTRPTKNQASPPLGRPASIQSPRMNTTSSSHTSKITASRENKRNSNITWQVYVDDHMMMNFDGQHLTSAAIVGLDGSIWAQSSSFPDYKPEEMAAIVKGFDDPSSLTRTGLFLGDAKYMVIQGEAGVVVRGKKGTGGICVKKTNMILLIGIYDSPMNPGQCNIIIERLGDYLIEQGY